jgi:hypothetical protein
VRRLSNPNNPIVMDVLSLEDLFDFIHSCDIKLQRMGKPRNGIAIRNEDGKWWITIID